MPRPRSFAGLALAGFALSVLLTFAMRAGDGGASVGFLFVCTIAAVPPPEFPGVLTTFAFEPIPVYVLVTIGAGYLLVFRAVRSGSQRRLASTRRLISFLSGLLLVLLTVFGPLAAYSSTFLTAHMIQHFVLITIAPPLLLAGAPLTLLLVAAGRARRDRWLYPLLHSRWFIGFTNPLVGLVLFAVIPVGWYISPAFEQSLTNVWLHYLGYGIFLFAGTHYWWPIVGVNPSRWNLSHPIRVAYLFALVPIHAFLGSLFYEPTQVIYEDLQALPRYWGPSPLFDQQIAGAMMFIVGEIIGIIATLVAASRWASADEREGKRIDAALARKRARAAADAGVDSEPEGPR
ncbi:MAG: cytochrome c oxidase assembly protein [Thermoflexaceae bacterium]|nr:cytochrome c oxidase assembly protein [Thermoflexaceae bacterium]